MLLLNHTSPLKQQHPQSRLTLQRLFIHVPIPHRLLQIPRLDILQIICHIKTIQIPVLKRDVVRDRTMRLPNTFRVAANLLPLVLMAIPLHMVTPQIPISLLCQNQMICQ